MSDSTVASSVGSGLKLYGPTSTLTNVTLTGNADRGIASSGALTMVDCEVSGNAGGIESFGGLTVNGGTIRNNIVPSPQEGGGGIYSGAGRVTLNSVRITDNATGGRGGGVYAYEERAGSEGLRDRRQLGSQRCRNLPPGSSKSEPHADGFEQHD